MTEILAAMLIFSAVFIIVFVFVWLLLGNREEERPTTKRFWS